MYCSKSCVFAFLACIFILSGCSTNDPTDNPSNSNQFNGIILEDVNIAIALIRPTYGHTAKGKVTFTKTEYGIKVVADIEGLTPGKHGFHIHEKGDCSAKDASSAGGHFNPLLYPHDSPDASKRHVGDLGNVDADATGYAHFERIDAILRFDGATSILGKSVIVHAQPDDFVTQPTGNAGVRIGCGIIEPAN